MICASEPVQRQSWSCLSSLRSNQHSPNGVNIEGSGAALVKGRLHGRFLRRTGGGVVEPVGIHSVVNSRSDEYEASISEVIPELVYLGKEHAIPEEVID